MPTLAGKTIAITEARRVREMVEHIAKLGGTAVVAPALREVPSADPEDVRAAIRRICAGEVHWAIFLTGVGARAVLAAAEAMGLAQVFIASLSRLRVAARGPKPIAALREAGVRVDLVPAEPTSEGLVRALEQHELRGLVIALQLYGEPNPYLVGELERRGATVLEMQPYRWDLPEDQGPLECLVRKVIAGLVDAVAFTSGPQVRHLFVVAGRLGLDRELTDALATRVPVAAVGEVTEQALAAQSIIPRIRPPKPTMGALVVAIARALGASTPSADGQGSAATGASAGAVVCAARAPSAVAGDPAPGAPPHGLAG